METIISTLLLIFISAINGQTAWNPSTTLSRVPGLHQAGGTMAFPQFLSLHTSYSSGSTHKPACPRVNHDCPKPCRKADSKGCRVCDCSEARSGSCPDRPSSCPESCRKRDNKGCKICSCEKGSSGSRTLSSISSSAYSKCYSMIMCMLSCKRGYTLGAVTSSHGCQTCQCIDSRGNEEKQDNSNGISKAGSSSQNSVESGMTGSYAGNDLDSSSAWQNGVTETGSMWESIKQSKPNQWESGTGQGGSGGNGDKDVWSASSGVGDSSGCSGPLCPGSSDGMNPMFPGASSNTGEGISGAVSCTGPFCAGHGAGMSGVGGGMDGIGGGVSSSNLGGGASGSGACTGPFCIGQGTGMGGMGIGMGGTGGGGSSGCTGPFCAMSGSSAAMGGASSGMGGTSGDTAINCREYLPCSPSSSTSAQEYCQTIIYCTAFSPFGLAANSGTGGGSSSCNGPFCTMATGNGVGGTGGRATMTSSFGKDSFGGQHSDCTGPSCAAKDGQTYKY